MPHAFSNVGACRPSAGRIEATIDRAVQDARGAPYFRASVAGGVVAAHGMSACRLQANETADVFVSWNWDGTGLRVRNDRFGLMPLFVYRHGSEIAISPSLVKLLVEGAASDIDEAALSVFLRLGFFVGDDTPFVSISTLPPGCELTWTSRGCDVTGGPYLVAATSVTWHAAIETAAALMHQGITRRLPVDQRFVVPLSGGRDSRHILLELDRCGYRPDFVVTVPRYPPAAPEDVRVASRVSAALGVRHKLLEPTEPRALAEARKNIATHFCADEHAWFFAMLDHIRDRVGTVYEGIGGSLWGVGWLPDAAVRERWRRGDTRWVADRMLTNYHVANEAFLNAVTPQTDGPGFHRSAALDRLSKELDRHVGAPDPGKSFHFWNRLRRELALVPFDLMRASTAVHTPLVDRDLVDFLLSLDPALVSPTLSRSDKRFHTETIARTYPDYAALPFEDASAPPSAAGAHNRRLVRDVARYLLSHAPSARAIRSSYVWPRLAYALVNGRYAESSPWLATTALYFSQLSGAVSA